MRNGRMDLLATNTLGRAMHSSLYERASGPVPNFARYTFLDERWSSDEVRLHGAGTKSFHHTVVGDLELAYESVDMGSEPGLTFSIYAAEPATRSAEALALSASWAAPETARVR